MIDLQARQDRFELEFERFEQGRSFVEPVWLQALRRQGLAERGIPSTKLEEWKYTDLSATADFAFSAALPDGPSPLTHERLGALAKWDGPMLVFFNGRFAPALSMRGTIGSGCQVFNLAEAIGRQLPPLERVLGRGFLEPSGLTAFNTAFMNDGAFIWLPRGATLPRPILLLFVAGGAAGLLPLRNVIVAEENSEARIVERYVSLDGRLEARQGSPGFDGNSPGTLGPGQTSGLDQGGPATYCTNVVTQIEVGPGARIDHIRIQEESPLAYHISSTQAHLAVNAVFATHSLMLGGVMTRNDVGATLDGEGADCTLSGLVIARDRQHIDNRTVIDHAKPHGTSHELYKNVIDGAATAIFNGKIVVQPNAQKTDAFQQNRSLLLSEAGTINAKPQLEIYADDVKCAHGATIGQIDSAALFYLRSRGIAKSEARAILTHAFAAEIVDRIKVKPLREALSARLMALLGDVK